MNLISGETLRILLVCDALMQRDEVDEVLHEGAGDYRLYWVSQPDLAPVRAHDLAPHVILVDEALADADAVGLIGQLATRMPNAAVLAMVEMDAMNRARQAVLAGARGFVIKPLQEDEFIATLRQVLNQRSGRAKQADGDTVEVARGRILVFCAPKGGTGRTTLAINTAITLQADAPKGVVILDADYAAPAVDVALNLHSERNIGDLIARLSHLDEELVNSVLATHATGLKVLMAPPPNALDAPPTMPQVQQILARLRRMFSWVIVDLGLPTDETAFAFLDTADRIIMSVLPEMVGLRNTRLMLDQFAERAYTTDKVGLVLNRATMQGGVPPADIEERLHIQLLHQIPDDQPLATLSVNRGVPLVISHRRSSVARSVQQLARMLTDEMNQSQAHEQPATEDRKEEGRNLMQRILGARAVAFTK